MVRRRKGRAGAAGAPGFSVSTGMAVTYPEGRGEETDTGTKLAAGCRTRLQERKEERLSTFRQRLARMRCLRYYKVKGTPPPRKEPITRQNAQLWPHPHPFLPIVGGEPHSRGREERGREGRSTLESKAGSKPSVSQQPHLGLGKMKLKRSNELTLLLPGEGVLVTGHLRLNDHHPRPTLTAQRGQIPPTSCNQRRQEAAQCQPPAWTCWAHKRHKSKILQGRGIRSLSSP